ncbi:MAG TPA: RDD family protein, partial [Phycisphaerales bacterium]|nr:RDD family protein [Phycisphaerales bacterium]
IGWLAMPQPGSGVYLFAAPADVPPGTLIDAGSLPRAPLGMAARGGELVVVFDADPKGGGDGKWRPVRQMTAQNVGRPGLYRMTEPSALPPLPAAGEIRGLALTRTGPIALLVDERTKLFALRGGSWEPVELPTELSDPRAKVMVLAGSELVVLLRVSTSENAPSEVWSSAAPAQTEPAWSRQAVAVRDGVAAAWFVRDQLIVAYGGEGGGYSIELVRGDQSYPRGAISRSAGPACIGVSGDRIAAYGVEYSPAFKIVSHVISVTGGTLFDGAAQIPGPVTKRDIESLMLLLGSLALSVAVFVARPVTSDAIAFPEGYALAESSRRFIATLIDLAPGVALAAWLYHLSPIRVLDLAGAFTDDLGLRPLIVSLGGAAALSAVSEAVFGRTLGKLLVGCRTISTAGSRLNPAQAIARNLVKYACPPLAMVALLGPPSAGPHSFGTLVVRPVRGEPGKNGGENAGSPDGSG